MSGQESPTFHSSLPLLKVCLQNQCFSRGLPSQLSYSTALSLLCFKNNRLRPRNKSRHPNYLSLRLQQQIEAARQWKQQLEQEVEMSRLGKGNSGQQMEEGRIESDRRGLFTSFSVNASSQQDIDSLNMKFQFTFDDPLTQLSAVDVQGLAQTNFKKYTKLIQHLTDLSTDDFFQFCLTDESCQFLPSRRPEIPLLRHYLKTNLRPEEENPQQTVLAQLTVLQRHCQNMLEEEEDHMCFRGRLEEHEFWKKIVYLMSRSNKYHSLIEVHLNEHGYRQLAQHFRLVTQGQRHCYSPDLTLAENQQYRTFLLMLDRQWSKQDVGPPCPQLLATICQQINLKILFSQSYQDELDILSKCAETYLDRLAWLTQEEELGSTVQDLLALGQIGKIVKLMESSEKIDILESLLLLTPLFTIDPSRSTFLLYSVSHTHEIAQNLLAKAVTTSAQQSFHLVVSLLTAFSPLLRQLPSAPLPAIQLLVLRLPLLKFIVSHLSLLEYCAPLGLTFFHLPQLIEQLLSRHKCSQFAAMLIMQGCFPLLLERWQEQRQKEKCQYGQVRPKREKQQCIDLFGNAERPSKRDVSLVLRKAIQIMAVIFIKSDRSYSQEELHEAEEATNLLSLLRLKEYKKITSHLDQQLLAPALNTLLFSNTIIQLKHSLYLEQLHSMLSIFNLFLSDLAAALESIELSLGALLGKDKALDRICEYLELLAEGVMKLKERKPKVVLGHKALFRQVLTKVLNYLKEVRDNSSVSVQKVQKFLIEYGWERH